MKSRLIMKKYSGRLSGADRVLQEIKQREGERRKETTSSAAIQDHFARKFGLIKEKKPSSALQAAGQSVLSQGGFDFKGKDPAQFLAQREQSEALHLQEKKYNYIHKLTLAQRMGIVEKPPLPLNTIQWAEIEAKAISKFSPKDACPICCELFRGHETLLLSCGHIFHKACLQSFQRYMGRSRACPLCRKTHYDSKLFVEGQKKFLLQVITHVQARMRGWLVRRAFYESLKNKVTPEFPVSKIMRRKVVGYKLSLLGKKVERQIKRRQATFNKVIDKLHSQVLESDNLLQTLLPRLGRRMEPLSAEQIFQIRGGLPQGNPKVERVKPSQGEIDWRAVKLAAAKRGTQECPICLSQFSKAKEKCLLSCSHVFHQVCLQNFEKFDLHLTQQCPICRQAYRRILV